MPKKSVAAIFALTLSCLPPAAPAQAAGLADTLRTIAPAENKLGLEVTVVPSGATGADAVASGKLPIGSEIGFRITVSKPSRIYMLMMSAEGEIRVIFPNKFDRNNKVEAAGTIDVPGQGESYSFKVSGPKGVDLIKTVAVTGEDTAFEAMLWSYFDQQEAFPKSVKPTSDIVTAVQAFFEDHSSLVWAEESREFEIVDK